MKTVAVLILLSLCIVRAADAEVIRGSKQSEPMVDVRQVCPKVVIDLRYATAKNVAGRAIYPAGARCLLRKSVAERLQRAQVWLEKYGLGLKVWDAYRPAWAQQILWDAAPNPEFVGEPARGGSLHTWGVAVDLTLVDRFGKELKMPSGFDEFTAGASMRYHGKDPVILRHLQYLHGAMRAGGFRGMRDEWWHFVAEDYLAFAAVDVSIDPR